MVMAAAATITVLCTRRVEEVGTEVTAVVDTTEDLAIDQVRSNCACNSVPVRLCQDTSYFLSLLRHYSPDIWSFIIGFNNLQNRSRFDIEEARKADFDVEAANEEFRKMEISKGEFLNLFLSRLHFASSLVLAFGENDFSGSGSESGEAATHSGAKSEAGSQQTETKPGYCPDQFFDNISCDAVEKEQQMKQREQ